MRRQKNIFKVEIIEGPLTIFVVRLATLGIRKQYFMLGSGASGWCARIFLFSPGSEEGTALRQSVALTPRTPGGAGHPQHLGRRQESP